MKTVWRRVLPENPEDGAIYFDTTAGMMYEALCGEWIAMIPGGPPSVKAEEERETPYEETK